MGVYYENKSLKELQERKKNLEELTAENKVLKSQASDLEVLIIDLEYRMVLMGLEL